MATYVTDEIPCYNEVDRKWALPKDDQYLSPLLTPSLIMPCAKLHDKNQRQLQMVQINVEIDEK